MPCVSLYRSCWLRSLSAEAALLSVLLCKHSRRNTTLCAYQNHSCGWSSFTCRFSGPYNHSRTEPKWDLYGLGLADTTCAKKPMQKWSPRFGSLTSVCLTAFQVLFLKHRWEAGKCLLCHVKGVERRRAIFTKGLKASSMTGSICPKIQNVILSFPLSSKSRNTQ